MGRVEKNEAVERQLATMKGEMIQAARRNGKKSVAAPACIALLAFVVVGLLAGMLLLAIAGGVVTVPGALKDWYQQQRV